MKKRLLAVLTAVLMLIALLPMTVSADSTNTFYVDAVNGDDSNPGTETDPFSVYSSVSRACLYRPGSDPCRRLYKALLRNISIGCS